MAKVYYVTCPSCNNQHYLDEMLYKILKKNPEQKVKCPYCKMEFVVPC